MASGIISYFEFSVNSEKQKSSNNNSSKRVKTFYIILFFSNRYLRVYR